MRRKKHVIPLGFELINVYLKAGFKLKELVIKRQHNCKTTGFWYASSIKHNFLLLAHEYLPIFEKPRTRVSSRVEEEGVGYSLLVPTLERPLLKRKLDELETTTVWVLPAKDFEKRLNKNVIERYSNGGGYSTVTFTSHSNRDDYTANSGSSRGLLFIKAPFLSGCPSRPNIDSYLRQTLEITAREVREMSAGGFVVLQMQDVRMGDYLEPVAKRLVDSMSLDDLWLKEIIVVAYETQNSDCQTSERYLRINHQYLIVYEVKK